MPVSHPAEYAADLAQATGRFYTQGMPEDTKALKTGVLTDAEFLAQARIAGDENRRQYHYVLDRFERRPAVLLLRQRRSGLAHDVAGARPGHPAYDPATDAPYAHVDRGSLRRASTPSSATRCDGWARTICSW